MFVRGLEDDRYVVERFKAMADGDIRRIPGDGPATTKRRRNAKRATASLKAVQELRPERNEIIICTGLRIKGSQAPLPSTHQACSASGCQCRTVGFSLLYVIGSQSGAVDRMGSEREVDQSFCALSPVPSNEGWAAPRTHLVLRPHGDILRQGGSSARRKWTVYGGLGFPVRGRRCRATHARSAI